VHACACKERHRKLQTCPIAKREVAGNACRASCLAPVVTITYGIHIGVGTVITTTWKLLLRRRTTSIASVCPLKWPQLKSVEGHAFLAIPLLIIIESSNLNSLQYAIPLDLQCFVYNVLHMLQSKKMLSATVNPSAGKLMHGTRSIYTMEFDWYMCPGVSFGRPAKLFGGKEAYTLRFCRFCKNSSIIHKPG
jgi:hypothetical protein